tara:strand:+ start:523 stop:789 length:267 start_codon:yes stop_codon:yes gene_type:complete
MIIGIIGLILGSVATALICRKEKTTEEKLRDIKARIEAADELSSMNLTRAVCGSEQEQKMRRIAKLTKKRQNERRLEAFKAEREKRRE